LVWVDHIFIKEGIRQQRQQQFDISSLKDETTRLINDSMENCFVNGLPNENISDKIVPNRIIKHNDNELQPINHPIYKYVKLEVNTYIGNPN